MIKVSGEKKTKKKQLIGRLQGRTCCLLLKTCARCFPTSAERFRHTHQGWSMTLAAASRDAGHVRAATMPGQGQQRQRDTQRNATCNTYGADPPLTGEHGVLEGFLRDDADQPVQQGGQRRAQIPEEAGLPHQAVLLPALAQAAPRGLEGTWNAADVTDRENKQAALERLWQVKCFLLSFCARRVEGLQAWLRRAARFYGNRCRRFFA